MNIIDMSPDQLKKLLNRLIDTTNDVELKQMLCYMRDEELDYFYARVAYGAEKYPGFDAKDIICAIAEEELTYQKQVAYCRAEAEKRPAPNEKTAHFLDLLQAFDQPESDIWEYKTFKEVQTLARDPEVDANATLFSLGNPLHYAVALVGTSEIANSSRANREKFLDLLTTLIERGADVNKANAGGATPIMFADWQADVVKLLHQHGADLGTVATNRFMRNASYSPCLFTNAFSDPTDHSKERFEIVDYMLENGYDENLEQVEDFKFLICTYKDPEYALSLSQAKLVDQIRDLDWLLTTVAYGLKRKYKAAKAAGTSASEFRKYVDSYARRLAEKLTKSYRLHPTPEQLAKMAKDYVNAFKGFEHEGE